MDKVSHSHKVQVRLCRIMEFTLIILIFSLPLSCLYFLYLPEYNGKYTPLNAEWMQSETIYFIVDNLVITFVLLQMYVFCKGVRKGELFTNKRIKNVKYIGLTLVIGYILNILIRLFFESSSDDWNSSYVLMVSNELYSLQQLLLGAGILSLSYIFDKGRELKEENELVI